MSNLFVFGNGFDLAHDFKTSFNDFEVWLNNKYDDDDDDESLDEFGTIPQYSTNYKRLESYNLEEMAHFFYELIYDVVGSNWNQFESALSKLDWISIIKKKCLYYNDFGFNDRELMFCAEDIAVGMRDFAHVLINKLFSSWAKEIDISHPKTISKELMVLADHNHDYFLNFNYTDTLEIYYNVNNICHIHGQSSKNDTLIVGHAGKYKYPTEEEYDIFFPCHQYIAQICDYYRKDTKNIYEEHIDFFNALYNSTVNDIYVHGFSFADVDMYYLNKIAEKLDVSNVRIHLHSYKKGDFKVFKRKLINCGFCVDKIIPFRLSDIDDED